MNRIRSTPDMAKSRRRDVLMFLMDGREYTSNDIARLAKVPLPVAVRTLADLSAMGLVEGERVNGCKVYRVRA